MAKPRTMLLLAQSRAEVMRELALTEDGLKQRWRSIHRAAERVEPGVSAGQTGAYLRRVPLQRLRHNLVEVRPYE